MGNGVSGDQGDLPSRGKRDVSLAFDRKQHDWSEQARAKEVHALSSNPKPYIRYRDFNRKRTEIRYDVIVYACRDGVFLS